MLQLLRQITAQQEAWYQNADTQTAAEKRLAETRSSYIVKREILDLTEEDDPTLLELLKLQ